MGRALKRLRGITREPIRTPAVEEVKAILRALDHAFPRRCHRSLTMLRAFVYAAAFCGLRWGETPA